MERYINTETARIYVSDFVCEEMKKIPTADVVEVVHGEWKKKTDDIYYWYECSECSEPVPYNKYKNMYFSDYCPNCGAKMDKESETE